MNEEVKKILDESGVQEASLNYYPYRGANGREAACKLRIRWKGETALVVFTELPDNPGMSITNASEQLAAQVVGQYGLHPAKCLFVEHYRAEPGITKETWSVVGYDWDQLPNGRWKAVNVSWEHLDEADARKLLSRFQGGADA